MITCRELMQSQNTSEYSSPLLLKVAKRPYCELMAQETISAIHVKPITKNILITTFIRCLRLWAFSLSVVVIALSVPQNPKVIFHTKMTKKTKIESWKNDHVIFWSKYRLNSYQSENIDEMEIPKLRYIKTSLELPQQTSAIVDSRCNVTFLKIFWQMLQNDCHYANHSRTTKSIHSIKLELRMTESILFLLQVFGVGGHSLECIEDKVWHCR